MTVIVKDIKEIEIQWRGITALIKGGLHLVSVEGYTSDKLGYSLELAIMEDPEGFVEFAQAICDNLVRQRQDGSVMQCKGEARQSTAKA